MGGGIYHGLVTLVFLDGKYVQSRLKTYLNFLRKLVSGSYIHTPDIFDSIQVFSR